MSIYVPVLLILSTKNKKIQNNSKKIKNYFVFTIQIIKFNTLSIHILFNHQTVNEFSYTYSPS